MTVKRLTPMQPSKREPPVPRLCVSPTIPQGMSARLFPRGKPIHVYATKTPMRGVTPRDVWDAKITDERWLLPGIKLEKYSIIDAAIADDIYEDMRQWHRRTRRPSSWKQRLAILWRCCAAVPQHAKGLRWVERCVESFEIDPISMWESCN